MAKNLKDQVNTIALTYTGDATYLRYAVLDEFDGKTWTVGPRSRTELHGVMLTPPGLTSPVGEITQKEWEIKVSKSLRSPWLSVPYPPRHIAIDGRWEYDPQAMDVISADRRPTAGEKYKVTAYDVNPSVDDLRDAIATSSPDSLTSVVPRDTPQTIRELAAQITKGAQGNHYLEAVRLQNWFRSSGGFTYSTAPNSASGIGALVEFLFDSKTGYCEQFATSMALLARILHIPARVALGFLPGSVESGHHVVRMKDMHAWPELYFDGIGWVRFDPTPAQRSGTAPDWTQPSYHGPEQPSAGATAPPATSSDPEQHPRTKNGGNLTDETGAVVVPGTPWWRQPLVRWGIGVLGVIMLALVPWLIRSLIRRHRFGHADVEALWTEVRDTARDLRLDWPDPATPRRCGTWLAAQLPADSRPQAVRLSRAVEFERYAAATRRQHPAGLREAAADVRRSLIDNASTANRWRARLLPRSWRWYLARGATDAPSLLDRLDLTAAHLRRHALRRRRAPGRP
ncbi:MAG: transglutaminase domain-containing protein [Catenulispora sp.]|nr:transglutaminase domain-containing protein [Catenulispora sp.]